MAISFKEAPWYIQALVFVALAIVLLAAGEYTPGLAGSPGAGRTAEPARSVIQAEPGSERPAGV